MVNMPSQTTQAAHPDATAASPKVRHRPHRKGESTAVNPQPCVLSSRICRKQHKRRIAKRLPVGRATRGRANPPRRAFLSRCVPRRERCATPDFHSKRPTSVPEKHPERMWVFLIALVTWLMPSYRSADGRPAGGNAGGGRSGGHHPRCWSPRGSRRSGGGRRQFWRSP